MRQLKGYMCDGFYLNSRDERIDCHDDRIRYCWSEKQAEIEFCNEYKTIRTAKGGRHYNLMRDLEAVCVTVLSEEDTIKVLNERRDLSA